MGILDSYLDQKKNVMVMVEEPITACLECGSQGMEKVRASMRRQGQPDKDGLYCAKCRKMYFLKSV